MPGWARSCSSMLPISSRSRVSHPRSASVGDRRCPRSAADATRSSKRGLVGDPVVHRHVRSAELVLHSLRMREALDPALLDEAKRCVDDLALGERVLPRIRPCALLSLRARA